MRTTVARRVIAGAALVIGLPLATAGIAAAQSGPSGPSGPGTPSGPSGPGGATTSTTTATSLLTTTTREGVSGNAGLPRTGGDLALPLAAAGGAIAIVLGGRRLAARA